MTPSPHYMLKVWKAIKETKKESSKKGHALL